MTNGVEKIWPLMTAQAAGVIDDAPRISSVLGNVVNFLLSIVGTIAVIAFLIAGILYFLARGNQRQIDLAKRMFWAGVIGASVALGAYVIIVTLTDIIN